MSRKPSCYRKHLKDYCEACGFIPISKYQMDIHHADGNHENDDPANLETYCANCHRLWHANPESIDDSSEYGWAVKRVLILRDDIKKTKDSWFYVI